jgi:hypothetical protein
MLRVQPPSSTLESLIELSGSLHQNNVVPAKPALVVLASSSKKKYNLPKMWFADEKKNVRWC